MRIKPCCLPNIVKSNRCVYFIISFISPNANDLFGYKNVVFDWHMMGMSDIVYLVRFPLRHTETYRSKGTSMKKRMTCSFSNERKSPNGPKRHPFSLTLPQT